MKHTLSRVAEPQPGGSRQTQGKIEGLKEAIKWRQDGTGGGRDCKSKLDTYKRMTASRIQYNVKRAKGKVSLVFAVVE